MVEGERLLDPHEVAARLGLSVLTVRNKLRDGSIPGVHYGRVWRVREADLDEYVRQIAKAGEADRRARAAKTAKKKEAT